jgi:hypothetical protein
MRASYHVEENDDGNDNETSMLFMVALMSFEHYLLGCIVWDNFLSFYSEFYEVTILESTYATSEGKVQMYF